MRADGLLAAGAGALIGAGIWVLLMATRGLHLGREIMDSMRRALGDRPALLRLGACVGAGLLVWMVSGWPVAAVLAAAGAWWLPRLVGPDREHEARVARIEAVAAWAEQVRDLMASAAGLRQAIATTAPIAPEPIRAPIQRLAEELRQGRPPQQALAEFAQAVDVPTADLVAAALSSAASRHAADLGRLLGSLAAATREQAALLVRVAATRARVRTAMRIIIATTIGLATLLLAFNPAYLAPYDGPLGQLVLAVIGALWAVALVWIARLARTDLGPRVLRPGTQEVAP